MKRGKRDPQKGEREKQKEKRGFPSQSWLLRQLNSVGRRRKGEKGKKGGKCEKRKEKRKNERREGKEQGEEGGGEIPEAFFLFQ